MEEGLLPPNEEEQRFERPPRFVKSSHDFQIWRMYASPCELFKLYHNCYPEFGARSYEDLNEYVVQNFEGLERREDEDCVVACGPLSLIVIPSQFWRLVVLQFCYSKPVLEASCFSILFRKLCCGEVGLMTDTVVFMLFPPVRHVCWSPWV